jgi:hypothetical protein
MAEVGTKLVFENERVRVREFTLQPGETVPAHQHDHDYFFYPIEGGTLEVTRPSGVTQATLEAGKVYFRQRFDSQRVGRSGFANHSLASRGLRPRRSRFSPSTRQRRSDPICWSATT